MFDNNFSNKLIAVRDLVTSRQLGGLPLCSGGAYIWVPELPRWSGEPPRQVLTTVTPPKLLAVLSTPYSQRHRLPQNSRWALQHHSWSGSGSARFWVTEMQLIPLMNQYWNISTLKILSFWERLKMVKQINTVPAFFSEHIKLKTKLQNNQPGVQLNRSFITGI